MARSSCRAGTLHWWAISKKTAFLSSGCPANASRHCITPTDKGGGLLSNLLNQSCSRHFAASGRP
eukprot:191248-Pyramimonas_sp.AAC.1